jgi:hypothetical protein
MAAMMLLALTAASAAQAAPVYRATADVAPLSPVDTTTALTVFGPGTDDVITEIAAPFPVAVYGTTYTTLNVSSNGYVGFGPGTAHYLYADDTSEFNTPIVGGHIVDLYTAADGGVHMETRGTAPNRQAVIEWNVNICCDGGSAGTRFQVILTEGIATVEARYAGTLDYAGWIGIKRNAAEFTRPGDESSAYPAQDTRISYAPLSVGTTPLSNDDTPTFTGYADPSEDVDVKIYAGNDTTVAPQRSLTVTPDSAGDYSVTVPDADRLGDGDYTVQATQASGSTPPTAFTIDATGPDPKLTAPADGAQTAETKPVFTGTAGTADGDLDEVTIAIRAGTATSGDVVQTLTATAGGDGTFTATPASALAPGQYTARATQADDRGNTGTGPAVTFTVLGPKVEPAAPTVQPTNPPSSTPTTPTTPTTIAVCKSRRLIYKHVRRPSGGNLRVVATLDGRRIKRTIRRSDILIPVDLRGKPAGVYTLRVTVTRTLKSGERKTVKTVTRFVYRTCA